MFHRLFLLSDNFIVRVSVMSYSHVTRVKEYLEKVIDKDPDIFLISEDGEHVGTHRILLRLFSPVFSDFIIHQEQVSHVSVPASGSVLKHFISALNTGVAIATDVEELRAVSDLSRSFHIFIADWQIGLGRTRRKKVIENIELENKAVKDLVSNDKADEGKMFEETKNKKILPFQNARREIKLENESAKDFVFDGNDEEEDIFKDTRNTITNAKKNEDAKRGIIECEKCQETFTLKFHLTKHIRKFHALKKEKNESEIDNKPFDCDTCPKKFLTKKYLRRHVRETHDLTVKKESKPPCSKCKKSHGYNPKDDNHVVCHQCDKTFYGTELLRRHNNIKHGIFKRAKKVVKVYVPEDPNHCHDCKVACSSNTELIYHEDTAHNKGNPITCRFCNREFGRKARGFFLEHLRKHTGESPEICSHCGKSFKQKKALKNHERLHTGEKPYKCESCFAAFTQRTGLVSHQKSRNGCQSQFIDKLSASLN